MADITMCTNVLCKSKDYCYRFTAKASEFCQSYTNFLCEDDENNCSYFIANKCDKCGLTNGNHKMSCSTIKIQINL